jgi:hypothetical protein
MLSQPLDFSLVDVHLVRVEGVLARRPLRRVGMERRKLRVNFSKQEFSLEDPTNFAEPFGISRYRVRAASAGQCGKLCRLEMTARVEQVW